MTSLGMLCGAILPLILIVATVASAVRGVDAAGVFSKGVTTGLKTAVGLLPTLLGLLVAVYMLRASGILELLSDLAGWALGALGVPGEIAPIMLLRPFSGSGALATAAELMESLGPDSIPGRIAAVMLGSSETTVYTANIIFRSAKVGKTRYALPAALVTELVAGAASVALVCVWWG